MRDTEGVELMLDLLWHERCRLIISVVFGIDVLIESIGSGTALLRTFKLRIQNASPTGIVLYRLYILWRFERLWTYALFGAFVLDKIVVLTFAYVSIAGIQGEWIEHSALSRQH